MFNMRISPTVSIVSGYYLLVCAYLHKELGYIWQCGQVRAFLFEIWTKVGIACLIGIGATVAYGYVCRFFGALPSTKLIDDPQICGTEFCFTRGGRDHKFFLTVPQGSWRAKLFWLKRRCTIDNMRMIGSGMKLAGLAVPANVGLYDHMEK